MAGWAGDLVWVVLAAFQTVLAECVEAGKDFGRVEWRVAHPTLVVGACEDSAGQRGGG